MRSERKCIICHSEIPEREGIYFAELRILVHQEGCADKVRFAQKDTSRSRRGRYRSRADTLRILRGNR